MILLADPLGRGWNLFGLGDTEVSYVLSLHPSVLATIKVGCVVAGHVSGVIAAHDGRCGCCRRPPAHGSTGNDAGDGGLYIRRPIFAVRRVIVDYAGRVTACRATMPSNRRWPVVRPNGSAGSVSISPMNAGNGPKGQMHGYEPGSVTPTTELVLSHKHPDDYVQVAATLDDMPHPPDIQHPAPHYRHPPGGAYGRRHR